MRLRVTAAKAAAAEQDQAGPLHEEVLDRAAFEARSSAACQAPPPPAAKQSSRARAAAAYSALKPFVIISMSYLLFTITDGAIRMVGVHHECRLRVGGQTLISRWPYDGVRTRVGAVPSRPARTEWALNGQAAGTAGLLWALLGTAHVHCNCQPTFATPPVCRLQIVLLHAYQKGFSAMEVAIMFSFYEVRFLCQAIKGLGSKPHGCGQRPI